MNINQHEESQRGALEEKLQDLIETRTLEFLRAIQDYRAHPYRRKIPSPPMIWQDGDTKLFEYGSSSRQQDAILFVPSLINRSYILDLKPDKSLVRWLSEKGITSYLVDWGDPRNEEGELTLNRYIFQKLLEAVHFLVMERGQRVHLAGYCMGGLMTIPLAQAYPSLFKSLILMASPWDFHAASKDQARFVSSFYHGFAPLIGAYGSLPVDAVQILFTLLDPLTAARKFIAFDKMDKDSERASFFVALEDWLNDGIPLAADVAREALVDWYGRNLTGRGAWKVGGMKITPGALKLPTLSMVPANDRIVPPPSALALVSQIPGARLKSYPLGHIGMVTSSKAVTSVWHDLHHWIQEMS